MELEANFSSYVNFEPTALVFKREMPYETWESLFTNLKYIKTGVQWWIGDALAYGDNRFGERISQVLEESDMYTEDGLSKLKWVSQQVKEGRRRPEISWSAHREVASLEPEEQVKVLTEAVDQKLTIREVRAAVRSIKAPITLITLSEIEVKTTQFMLDNLSDWIKDGIDLSWDYLGYKVESQDNGLVNAKLLFKIKA